MLLNPNEISQCMPDLQKLDVESPDTFTVVVRAGVSFIKGDFTLHFNVAEKNAPTHAKMKAYGTGIGSTVDLETTMDISDAQDGGSSMKWAADAKVGGKVLPWGRGCLKAKRRR